MTGPPGPQPAIPPWVQTLATGHESLADRGVRAGLILAATSLSGFVALGLAWDGLAGKLSVPAQLPFLVSGGFGGAALAGTGAAMLATHLERRANATEHAILETAIRDAAELAHALRDRRTPAASANQTTPTPATPPATTGYPNTKASGS